MLSGLTAYDASFLEGVNELQDNIAQVNQQITSGVRVNQASDDPAAIASILGDQQQIDSITQVQANLETAKTITTAQDQALQTAAQLLDQVTTIAAEGASSTASAATRQSLGLQVQSLEQQMVDVANTSVNGQYVFGGDQSGTQPYTFNWASPEGVIANSTQTNTSQLLDANGSAITAGMTASQIFDAQSAGSPAPGNVFNALYSLSQALQTNNVAGIQAAASTLVPAAVTQIQQATTTLGDTETWIQNASSAASQQLLDIQSALSSVRDTDITQAAVQLTADQTAMSAALSAHSSMNVKSLFSYMG